MTYPKISNFFGGNYAIFSGNSHSNIGELSKNSMKLGKEYFISNLDCFYKKEEFIRDNLKPISQKSSLKKLKNMKTLEDFLSNRQ